MTSSSRRSSTFSAENPLERDGRLWRSKKHVRENCRRCQACIWMPEKGRRTHWRSASRLLRATARRIAVPASASRLQIERLDVEKKRGTNNAISTRVNGFGGGGGVGMALASASAIGIGHRRQPSASALIHHSMKAFSFKTHHSVRKDRLRSMARPIEASTVAQHSL